jgi:phosphodiesterase/alkaline phosphatase D-like protein
MSHTPKSIVKRCAYHLEADNGQFWEPFNTFPFSTNWKGLVAGQVTKHTATIAVGNPSLYPNNAILMWAKKDRNGVWRQQENIIASPYSAEIPWYRFELTGLKEGTVYSYFVVDAARTNRSVYARFKTNPSKCDPCPKRVRFAVSSCNGFSDFFQPIRYSYTNTGNLISMPEEDLDFQVQLGDLCYTDAWLYIADHPFPIPGYEHFMASISAYRNNAPFQQRLALSVPEFVEAWIGQSLDVPAIRDQLRSTSVYYINDDHEFFNNISFRGVIDQYTPLQMEFFSRFNRLPALPPGQFYTQNDIQSYWGITNIPSTVFPDGFEALDTIIPTKVGKTTGPGAGNSNSQRWYKVEWGPTIDLLVLDMTNDRGNGLQIFSPEQWEFIRSSLLKSKKPFKFIAGSKVMLNTDTRPIQERYDQILAAFILFNQNMAGGKYPLEMLEYCAGQELWGRSGDFTNMYVRGFPDGIPGLPKPEPSRDMLLEFIVENKINGVFFLSGDIHFGSLGHVGPSNIPSTPANPTGVPLHPITPEGHVWEIICSSAGSPFNNYAQRLIMSVPDQTMLYSATRTNTHTIIDADAENHTLTVEWVTESGVARDVLHLDKCYNVDKSCHKVCPPRVEEPIPRNHQLRVAKSKPGDNLKINQAVKLDQQNQVARQLLLDAYAASPDDFSDLELDEEKIEKFAKAWNLHLSRKQ